VGVGDDDRLLLVPIGVHASKHGRVHRFPVRCIGQKRPNLASRTRC
jgi:hypothetical protein